MSKTLMAQNHVDSLKTLLRSARTTIDSIQLIDQLGIAYSSLQTKRTDSLTIDCFETATKMSDRTHNNRTKIFSTIWKGIYYINRDNDKANKILKDAIDMAKATHDTSNEALGILRLGILNMTTGKPEALSNMNESVRLYGQLHDSTGLASCWTQLAKYYTGLGDYKKSIEYMICALKVVEKKGNSMTLGYLFLNMGVNQHYLGNIDIALEYYTKAETVFKAVKSERFIYSTLLNIGSVYEIKNDYQKAKSIYEDALERIKKNGDEKTMASCLRLLGSVYLAMKDYEKAASYLQQSLKMREHDNDNTEKCDILGGLANIYFEQGNYQKSLQTSDQFIKIALEHNLQFILQEGYKQKAKTYAKLNNFNKAYEYQLLHDSITDSILSEEKSKQITEMRTKYETDKKGREILLLNKDKEVMQARINSKNIGMMGIISGGALIILLVVLLYNRRNLINQNKYEKEINATQQQMALAILSAQEEERQKIAKDMHDSLGAYLSSLKINMEVLQPVITEEKQPIYKNILSALGKVTAEMRGIAKNLVSDTLQQYGLEIAIEELVELINMSGKITIDFSAPGEHKRLTPALETSVFRIVQELLNNTMKHAQATSVELRITESNEHICIEFKDNGIGFDPGKIKDNKKGIGMKNMEARTRILKGKFDVTSKPGEGTAFKIEIPYIFA